MIKKINNEIEEIVSDPVCGMKIPRRKANQLEYLKKTYFFCSHFCREKFIREPGVYINQTSIMKDLIRDIYKEFRT